jgi:hypothetical protein
VTGVLADAVDRVEFPTVAGVSARALSEVLSNMARIARTDGTFKYGLRASKVAMLTKYSLRVVRRAQQWLTEHGYLEKEKVGGGRAATKWRIVLDKLIDHLPRPELRHATDDDAARQQSPRVTGLGRGPVRQRLYMPWSRRDAESRPVAPSFPPPIEAVCEEHGSTAGILPSGEPRCPGCRHTLVRLRA